MFAEFENLLRQNPILQKNLDLKNRTTEINTWEGKPNLT